MSEVGLVRFACVAHAVASDVLPRYKTRYSKHVFTQPQLLALLLLMRFEDWTFRETEVRLREHGELREALGLERTPDHTALYKFMRRLGGEAIESALDRTVKLMPPPPSGGAVVAVDGTGLDGSAVSTYFVKRCGRSRKHYLKYLISVDTQRQMITSQMVSEGPKSDASCLPALVGRAARLRQIGVVVADAGFDSHKNHRFIREQIGANSVIKAGRGRPGHSAHGVRQEMKEALPETYSQRAHVEGVFSVIKRKLSRTAPGRTHLTRALQALLLGVAFNVYRLKLWLFTTQTQRTSMPLIDTRR
jgi:hypothetical protein